MDITVIPPPPNFDDSLPSSPRRQSSHEVLGRRYKEPRHSEGREGRPGTVGAGSGRPRKRGRHGVNPALEMAIEQARKVGGKIPGDDAEEVRRWVEERKRNWPSRANVARKLEEERRKRQREGIVEGELGLLGKVYKSDEESESYEVGKNKGNKGECRVKKRGWKGKGAKRRGEETGGKFGGRKAGTLLRKLLDKEIREEQNTILQCFRYLVNSQFLTSQTEEDYKL